ncbi:MAG: M28 family peptidase [Gemmatimonadetes bacterium]|nr:M28 family peptidase [Gemmatimonadota bacterium]MCC6771857.1 M28 family peptidase [Gemmatimonadaceae bacterium]
MRFSRVVVPACALGLACLALPAHAQRRGAVNEYGNPSRLAPAPTTSAISVRDLQVRLYQFADDSMQGRQVGRAGNMKGTAYIAAELQRLGLVPAGDNGTFFQVLPYHLRSFTAHSRLTVSGNPLRWEADWLAIPGARAPRPVSDAEVVFGGVAGDTTRQIAPRDAAGKFVVLLPGAAAAAAPGGRFAPPAPSRFAGAVAVATVDLDALTAAQRRALNTPTIATQATTGRGRAPTPAAAVDSLSLLRQQVDQLAPQAVLRLTSDAAARLFGVRSVEALTPGATGGRVTASLDYVELPSDYARNVVAIIPGSDPALAGQYVAIGAHNDHVGFATPVDKDSIKAFNNERNKRLLANKMMALTPAQLSEIRVNMDSIRRRFPQPRLDSINNGADDDGSGSMGVLEIAEYIQAMRVKPKRSTLFVWHTGEEAGLIGSAFFTRNPTVPLDSIVAQLNIDMIGRGREGDLPGGSSDYLGVVGSFFDSKDLGETVAAVNGKQSRALTLDYQYDSTMSWTGYNNIYGRSDHYNYALQGIPVAFFFTGLHGDYHQRSDEAEFIDYPHYARITSYIRDVTVEVANGPRPRINGTRPARPPRPTVP